RSGWEGHRGGCWTRLASRRLDVRHGVIRDHRDPGLRLWDRLSVDVDRIRCAGREHGYLAVAQLGRRGGVFAGALRRPNLRRRKGRTAPCPLGIRWHRNVESEFAAGRTIFRDYGLTP